MFLFILAQHPKVHTSLSLLTLQWCARVQNPSPPWRATYKQVMKTLPDTKKLPSIFRLTHSAWIRSWKAQEVGQEKGMAAVTETFPSICYIPHVRMLPICIKVLYSSLSE